MIRPTWSPEILPGVDVRAFTQEMSKLFVGMGEKTSGILLPGFNVPRFKM